MMRFFAQMFRYPLTVFVYSMEAFVSAMRDVQKTTDQTIDAMVGGVAQAVGTAPVGESGSTDSHLSGGVIADDANQTTRKEESKMADQDLSGEGLKYVSYSILFTKPNLEATLEEQKEELVNYSTNGGSYGGLKIAHFMQRVAKGEVPRPDEWKEPGSLYPPGDTGQYITKIPKDDEKYITFIYQVDRRLDKNDPNYPREQVKVLTEIRDRL
jgi:hypothetical protein